MLAKAQHLAHLGSWRWEPQSDHLEWSEEMYHIFGVDPATFQGSLASIVASAIHPDDRASVENAGILARNGIPTPLEYRVVHPDGEERIVWTEGETVYDAFGKPTGLIGVVQDITERKRTEDLLRRQNAYLDTLHETTLNLMGRLQLNDLLEAITQRAATLMGTTHGYIYLHEPDSAEMEMSVGLGIFEHMVGSTARPGAGVTGIVWQTGQALVIDDYQAWGGRLTKLGHERLCSVVGIPLKSGESVVGVFGLAYTDMDHHFGETEFEILTRFAHLASIALDNARLYAAAQQEIVERKRAADELRENRARLASVMNNTEDLILSIDRDLRLTFFNDPFKEMTELNMGREVRAGMHVFEFISPETRAIHAAYYERGFAGTQCRYEVDYVLRNGIKLYFETYLNPIYGEQREVTGLAIFTQNITERKFAEQELTRQRNCCRPFLTAFR